MQLFGEWGVAAGTPYFADIPKKVRQFCKLLELQASLQGRPTPRFLHVLEQGRRPSSVAPNSQITFFTHSEPILITEQYSCRKGRK